VESILIADLGWTKAEAAGAFAQVALHLEADLEPLLAGGGPVSEVKVKATK
jgi:hypothetical protein